LDPRTVLVLFLLGFGPGAQGAPAALATVGSPVEPAHEATVLEGSVSLADGIPAAGVVVVSDAGGSATTGADGRFRLELLLPAGTSEVRLTAVHTVGASTRSARLAVAVRPGGLIPVGDLALSNGCEPAWRTTFGHFEVLAVPLSIATWDDGNGPAAYGGVGGGVARLAGDRWEALPGTFTLGGIQALQVYDDGQGSKLYAGGRFLLLDGHPAQGLARWDGSAWEILHPNTGTMGMDIEAMAVFDDGQGGGPALFVAGDIELTLQGVPAHDVLRYDGTWSVLGTPLAGDRIVDLAVFDDGQGGGPELYASGTFDVGGTPTIDLARWNGTRWERLAAGFQGPGIQVPPFLEPFDDGLGGGTMLCAVGRFTSVGGVSAQRVARWNGVAWAPLGPGITIPPTDAAVFDNGTGPALYVGGTEGRMRRWDGSTWSVSPKPPLDASETYMGVVDDGNGPTLLVGAGGTLVRWEVDHWRFLPCGVGLSVEALALHDEGSGPALFAGGALSFVGGQPAAGIARWDGTAWSAVGSGVGAPQDAYFVRDLASFDEGGGPVLVVAGRFDTAGGASCLNVARWDGTTWSPLAAGLNGEVRALTVFDDGLGGGPALYAGGVFNASGATALAGVARWDGTAWSPLGAGVNASVRALAVHDDGLGGGPALYAGGSFTLAGGLAANRIARWDGTTWTPLGVGIGDFSGNTVDALLSFEDGGGPALWAGGSFTMAGGAPASHLARWDGSAWSATPGLVFGQGILDLAALDEGTGAGPTLFVAGNFTFIDGIPMRGIGRWDGSSWSSVGGSLPSGGGAVLLVADGGEGVPALFLGGTFPSVGGSDDSNVARWQGCASVPPTLACPDAVEASTFGTLGRVVTFEVTATGAGTPAPIVTCVPPSGSFFPLGTTMVHCTATDALGSQATCDFPVHVSRRTRVR